MGEGFTLRDQGLPHPLWGSRSPLSEGLTFPPAGRGGSAWLPPRGPPFCRGLLPASSHFCKLSPACFSHPRLRPCTLISAPHTLPPCSPQRRGARFQQLTFTLLICFLSLPFPKGFPWHLQLLIWRFLSRSLKPHSLSAEQVTHCDRLCSQESACPLDMSSRPWVWDWEGSATLTWPPLQSAQGCATACPCSVH